MQHYIVAYVNKTTNVIEHIAVSDGPIAENPIHPENMDALDIHFCEGELLGDGNKFIRGRQLIESLELQNGNLCFKQDHEMNNEMTLLLP